MATQGRTVIIRLQTGAQRDDGVANPGHSGVTPCTTVWYLGSIGMIRVSNRGDNGNTIVYVGLKSTNETNLHGSPRSTGNFSPGYIVVKIGTVGPKLSPMYHWRDLERLPFKVIMCMISTCGHKCVTQISERYLHYLRI